MVSKTTSLYFVLLIALGGQKPPEMGWELGCTYYSPLLVISLTFSNTEEKRYPLAFFFCCVTHPYSTANRNNSVWCVFRGAAVRKAQHFSSLQVFATHLRVQEGGTTPITEGHILISDSDTKREHLFLLLQRQPQHGVVELGNIPMNGGDRLSCEDLRTLAVRLEEWWVAVFCGSWGSQLNELKPKWCRAHHSSAHHSSGRVAPEDCWLNLEIAMSPWNEHWVARKRESACLL